MNREYYRMYLYPLLRQLATKLITKERFIHEWAEYQGGMFNKYSKVLKVNYRAASK